MKIATMPLALALFLLAPGCTEDADPPATSGDASSTGAEGSTGEPSVDSDQGSTTAEATQTEGTTGDDDASSSSGMPATDDADYFRGTSANFMTDGTPAGTDQILARRELRPEDSQVLETLYLVAEDDTWQRFDLVQQVDLDAQTFTAEFDTDFGHLVVEGEYTSGEDWAWDAWRSTSTYVDGFSEGWTVTSEDQVNADGSHEADKQVRDPEGTVMFVIEERLEAIDQAEYEDAVAALE